MSNLSLYWVLFVILKNICIIKANWITGKENYVQDEYFAPVRIIYMDMF